MGGYNNLCKCGIIFRVCDPDNDKYCYECTKKQKKTEQFINASQNMKITQFLRLRFK